MNAKSRKATLFVALILVGCLFMTFSASDASAQCGGGWYAPSCGPSIWGLPSYSYGYHGWCPPVYKPPCYVPPCH